MRTRLNNATNGEQLEHIDFGRKPTNGNALFSETIVRTYRFSSNRNENSSTAVD